MNNATAIEDLRWKKFPVGSDGFVCLVDVMGDDAAVTQAARVSYGNDARDEEGASEASDRQLIRYLMRHRHTTPFEMAEVKLLVRVPMDAWRQWIRHRTANVNEYSTRYQPAIDSMAVTHPEEWRLQASNNKQGSEGILREWPEGWTSCEWRITSWVVESPSGETWLFTKDKYDWTKPPTPGQFLTEWERRNQNGMQKDYNVRLELGVAREVARKDLPLSTYTEAYWKCDLHNILHFLGLRMDSHAQKEIRDFATVIGEQIIAPLFPEVWSAFCDYRLGGMFLTSLDKEALKAMSMHFDFQFSLVRSDLEGHIKSNPADFPADWSKEKCRERDEFIGKMQTLGLVAY